MKSKPPSEEGRDWVPLLLVLGILYLVLLLPFAALIGARPEIVAGVIGALTTALVAVITSRAMRK